MYKKQLDKFLTANNPKSELTTAAALAHFKMKTARNPEASEYIQDISTQFVLDDKPERKASMEDEREKILAFKNADEIVNYMRKCHEPLNHDILIEKTLEFESEVIPLLLKRLKTSFQDGYMELACLFLAACKNLDANILIDCYDEIRNPYTKSSVLLALGFQSDESVLPWIQEQYFALKKAYPDESYHEGAYYALWEMEGRFYPTDKGK